MLSKQLLFRVGVIFFIISTLGLLFFKVDEITVGIPKANIQAQMEPIFFIDGTSKKTHIKYEMVDPMVTILDSGDVAIQSNITLASGLNQTWGTMNLVAKVQYVNDKKSFYLEIPKPVQLNIRGKSSNDPGFDLWGKDTRILLEDLTEKLNAFFSEQYISEIMGKNLRIQAETFTMKSIHKSSDGIRMVMDVDQGIFIVITYFVMFLSVFIYAFAYFFVGDVGFKDKKGLGFRDPRQTPVAPKKK
ncbi:MAG: hypothetical protein Q9M10_03305, partial [Mariprofundaceae bacterium]|nr:hypothetical protein [Mariprofundaceae bacterium]